MSTTLVTCFFDTSLYRVDNLGDKTRYWDETIAYVTSPLVVYGDKDYINFIRKLRPTNLNTEYLEKNLDELEFYYLYDKIEDNRRISWPSADSRAPTMVHIIQCNKMVFLTDVANRNPFNTTHFAFIDCNLLKKMSIPLDILEDRLHNMKDKFYSCILGVTDHKVPYSILYQRYRFVFVGCFIGGSSKYCNIIEGLFREEFIKTVEAGYGHGEEMIYTKILYNNWDLFNISYGDYQDCISNMHDILQNEEYILMRCAAVYCDLRMHTQLSHCTDKLINAPNIKPVTKFKSMYYNYIANYYLGNEDKVGYIIKDMLDLLKHDRDVVNHYNENKSFYDTNLSYSSKWSML